MDSSNRGNVTNETSYCFTFKFSILEVFYIIKLQQTTGVNIIIVSGKHQEVYKPSNLSDVLHETLKCRTDF